MQAGCFHLVSSIAAAGLYQGTFTEDMFEEAEDLDHPYFRTKHESEALVRANGRVPWRVYRPGIVVGHSQTGDIDKIDGPYYFFKVIQKLRQSWPPLVPAHRPRGRLHQPRAGRFRRRGDGAPRAPAKGRTASAST